MNQEVDMTTRLAVKTMWKIARLAMLSISVLILGTLAYKIVLGWDWLDALYMATITVTTVGFEEVRRLDTTGRIVTIVLVLTSVGVFAYSITALTSLMVELELGTLLARRRMEKKIQALKGHYIICGYGRTGQAVVRQLPKDRVTFVVIEQHPDHLRQLEEEQHLYTPGDATHDAYLERAGIRQAKGLVAALGNDAENVYLVLSARQLNPELTIVSWASNTEAEQKVVRAGANYTISPYLLGGQRIAQLLTTPHALEFLDHAMGGSDSIRLGEIHITPDSHAIGKSLMAMGIRRSLGVIVIGIRRPTGQLEFNPPADQVLLAGDILIGIGSQEQLEKLQGLVGEGPA